MHPCKPFVGTLALALAVAQIAPAQARSHYLPRTERGRLVEQIVQRFAAEGAQRNETTIAGWAAGMGGAFAHKPIDQLRQAASAPSYDRMLASFGTPSFGTLAFNENLVYTSVTPCRIADTRQWVKDGVKGYRLVANEPRLINTRTSTNFGFQGGHPTSNCGLPQLNVKAIAVYLTAVSPDSVGHLKAWPAFEPMPNAAVLNFTTKVDIGNTAHLLDVGFRQFTVQPTSGMHFTADVVGYYAAPPPPAPQALECRSTNASVLPIPEGGALSLPAPSCLEGETMVSFTCQASNVLAAVVDGQSATDCLFRDPNNNNNTSNGLAFSRCCVRQ